MSEEPARHIEVRCPECDHPIATVPADHAFPDDLICPGCGAQLEAPGRLDVLLNEIGDRVVRLFRRGSGPDGKPG